MRRLAIIRKPIDMSDSRSKTNRRIGLEQPKPRPIALAVAAAVLALTLPARESCAGPTGEEVTAGAATVQRSGSSLTVDQSTPRAAINWQTFDIAPTESVRFNQPNASSIVLNRVLGQNSSHILGTLSANGQVFILNPNGVLFGVGAQVNVGGLVASTLNMTDQDFMGGRNTLTQGAMAGTVVNQAAIVAADGGYVALIAPQVRNDGSITAPNGTVALAAGDKVTLTLNNGSLLGLTVDEGTLNALVENKHAIRADGGRVILSANAMDQIARSVVNNSGVIEAGTISNQNGVIRLEASDVRNSGTIAASRIGIHASNDITLEAGSSLTANGDQAGAITVQSETGTTLVDGVIEAKGFAGNGGAIQLLGNFVGLTGTARIDASGQSGGGSVLVGGDYQGANSDVQNAYRTYVGPEVVISADAIAHGDGGKVIVWADDFTRFRGNISARGGAQAGDGGLVETSGHSNLEVLGGSVDTRAPLGRAGTWLLDPSDVDITTGTTTATLNGEIFTPNQDTAVINAGDLSAALETGNVNVTTTSGGAQAGTITVSAPVTRSAGAGTTTLTLTPAQVTAGGTITIAAGGSISGSNGHPLNVSLAASGVGATVAVGAPITTFGGNFSSTGTTFTNAGGPITTAGGSIDINHTTTVTIPSPLTSGGGNILIAGGSTFTYTSQIDAGAGTVTLQGSTDTLAMGVGSTTGTFNITQAQIATIATTGDLIFGRSSGTAAIHVGTNEVLDFGTKNATFRQASGGITVEGATVSGAILGSGSLSFVAGTGTFTNTQVVNTSGAINITADHVVINANIAGAGRLTIAPFTAATAMRVGRLTPTQVDFGSSFTTDGITSTARTIQFGDATHTGGITVAGPFNPGFSTLHLVTGSTIAIPSGANTITSPNVVLAGSSFNNAGSASIVTPGGRWLVYSSSPAGSTEGGLTAAAGSVLPRLYNRTYAANGPATISEAGNHLIYSVQPTLTVTADSMNRVYGDANPAFTYTSSGYVVDDGVTDSAATAGLSGSVNLTTNAVGTSSVGAYVIDAAAGTQTSGAGYALSVVDGTLTVGQRGITVRADDQSRIYGDANPALTHQLTGGSLVNSDTLSGTAATAATAATASSVGSVGSVVIGQGSVTAGSNYILTFVDGNLTITQRPITVTADNQNRAYGDSNSALTYQITSGDLMNGDGFSGIATTAATTNSNVGSSAIEQGTVAAGGNYILTFNNGTLTIGQRGITVTADDQNRIYGGANPALTYQLTGGTLVNGDTFLGSLSTTATATSNVGAHSVTQGTLAHPNYALAFNDGTLNIGARGVTVTADGQANFYGDADPLLTYSTSDLGAGALLVGNLGRTAGENAGSYAINQGSVTNAENANYLITFLPNALAIAPRALTISADNKVKVEGDAIPLLTASGIGFANGESVGNLSGVLSFATAAIDSSPVGSYAITPSGHSSSNYTITYVDGLLRVISKNPFNARTPQADAALASVSTGEFCDSTANDSIAAALLAGGDACARSDPEPSSFRIVGSGMRLPL
jgi:filamentous hemagglutinin family protein